MQELSHADLVTKARNTEGTMVLVTGAGGDGERIYCCNPTEEMLESMERDAEMEREADAAEAEQLEWLEGSTENDDAAAGEANDSPDTDGDGQPNPQAA